MVHQRRRIRMSADEAWDFLGECRNLQVATLNRDGSPHLSTLWFAPIEGAVVFDTYAKSQKAVNVAREPRVAVLAEMGTVYEDLRGVSINGVAEIVRDPTLERALKVQIARRYSPGTPLEDLERRADKTSGKRIVIRLAPRKIVSWDHRKL